MTIRTLSLGSYTFSAECEDLLTLARIDLFEAGLCTSSGFRPEDLRVAAKSLDFDSFLRLVERIDSRLTFEKRVEFSGDPEDLALCLLDSMKYFETYANVSF